MAQVLRSEAPCGLHAPAPPLQVFEKSRTEAGADKYVIRVSYLEIYQDRLFDLLAATPEFTGGGEGDEGGEAGRKDGSASDRSPAGEARPEIRGGLTGVLQVRDRSGHGRGSCVRPPHWYSSPPHHRSSRTRVAACTCAA